jgi:hypothetical protein
MAITTVSIGSNQSIDTEDPASSTGSGPSYVVTFGTTPSGISVGDIGFMDTEPAGGGDESDYTFLVTVIDGANITLKYLTDTGGEGDASPYGLYTGQGSSGSPTQAPMVFKRAFSTITLFEAMIDDALPAFWGSTDDVVGECHADSPFTSDSRVRFTDKQSLASVKLTVVSGDRHDGTANSGVVIRPTAYAGGYNSVIEPNIDNFIIEWIEIDLTDTSTTKAIWLLGTNDDNIIRNNIIHSRTGNPTNYAVFGIHVNAAGASTDTMSILNNIIYDFRETSDDVGVGINTSTWQGTVNIYNNTVHNIEGDNSGSLKAAIGFKFNGNANSVANVKNNIVSQLIADTAAQHRAYWDDGTGTSNVDYNLSDDTTDATYEAQGANSIIDATAAEIAFVSTGVGTEDLHLDADSVCRRAGVNLGTTNEVNIDIDGRNRDETNVGSWDIGADQGADYLSAFLLSMI